MIAVGVLAVGALAGGVVVSQTKSAGPPDASPEPVDDAASVRARSSAWTHEATPVLAAVELELRRTEEVRHRWDTSFVARRGGRAPGAVAALLGRQAELAHHRETLRAAMAAVRVAPASETALANAWPQLWSAQEMLQTLLSGRSAFGDPMEAAVLRLVLDEGAPVTSLGARPAGRNAPTATPNGPGGDTATVELPGTAGAAARTAGATPESAESAQAARAFERVAAVASSTRTVSGPVVQPLLLGDTTVGPGPETSEPNTPELVSATDLGGVDTAGGDQEQPRGDGPALHGSLSPNPTTRTTSSASEESSTPSAVHDAVPDETMLTFDRRSPDAPASEPTSEPAEVPTAEELASSAFEGSASADTDAEAFRSAERPDT